MVRDRVGDDLQQLFLRVDRSNGESVEQLYHETSESLESTWDADGWADFNEDPFRGMDVYLQLAGLVDGRVEQGEEALGIVSNHCDVESQVSNLVGNIRSCIADVAIHLAHDSNMLVTVQ